MVSLNGFNAHTVDPATDFEPLPAGRYLVVITESQMKATKSGVGRYLELTFEVIDGEHKGRKLWSRLNLENPNAQAVEIAQAELSAICRAIGVMTPSDSAELHNQPLVVTVRAKPRADNGEIGNEIRAYAKKEAIGTKPQSATTTPPWRR